MNNVKTVVYIMIVVVFLAVHCNARIGKESQKSVNKRACGRPGAVCTSTTDCCGHDDPESGHCVLCTGILAGLFGIGRRTCSCSSYSVGVDPVTHKIVTDVCDGRDRSGSRVCRTRVAPPGDSYYRGDDYYNSRGK
ncbi:unnamed protein product [Rotaria magnacalcarata]|uniref:Uncharacterized protein n=2 Tax=Rotaria magnacalcarata TaxID=392030 RepID=A0A816PVU8_9BILA|nr:unnamed protein product [Rotaria magnacalcarata]CAF2052873.1 unnamed protein product [Rotaria magnacalcarata]CAF2099748.1 unnamed protein product [Rotaria magnacalcarata]CAF4025435.1 unnamed protein product [Rotaria magnacalcarata]CAF4040415.1 unnamed protein product [Rotaria magnacalcarata]